jgi:hypothetical protein
MTKEFCDEKPSYQAFGESGVYLRPARTICELPTADTRMRAIKAASKKLGLKVNFGVPVWISNKFTPSERDKDGRDIILLKGCDLPLNLIWSD